MAENKKLCAVTTIDLTMESFVIPSMRLFVQNGYDVTLICSMSDDFVRKYSMEFNLVNLKMQKGICLRDFFTKPFEMYRVFKKEGFAYIQYATTNASIYASVAAWAARIPHRVCLLWGIGYYTKTGIVRGVYKMIEKLPCMFANHVSVPSRKNQRLGAESGFYKIEHSSVVGDGGTIGVDLQEFDINLRSESKKEILSSYPILSGKLVYGYLGRIYKDKGVGELLEAFIQMNDANSALMIIGPVDTSRASIDEKLMERAKADVY